jgi:hypothetical protein
MNVSRRIVLHFPPNMTGQPVVCRLVRDFGLTFNIIKASISPGQEGLLVLELSGERKNYDKGIKYLTETALIVELALPSVPRRLLRWSQKREKCCLTIINALSAGCVSRLVLLER